jgi:LPS sulfotransferase NodH
VDSSVKETILSSVDDYFDNQIFKKYDRTIAAVGFKIFYHHPVYDHEGKVWSYLQNCDGLRVIHLRRANLLRSLVSMKIAEKTDVWKITEQQDESLDKTIQLNVKECLENFCQTRDWEKQANIRFANNPVLELTYEELISDYRNQMQRIQDFLAVNREDLHPASTRQNPEALRDLIGNYDELEAYFVNTEWAVFFE